MCNKRIRIYKYNGLTNIMTSRLISSLLISFIFFSVSCRNETPVYSNDVVVKEYPKVAEAIVERDAATLLSFSNHPAPEVRRLSWRALAKTNIENSDTLLNAVIRSNEHAAWLAFSNHNLSEDGRVRVLETFSESPNEFQHACELFKRQGEERELEQIIKNLSALDESYLCTVAAGRIIAREEVSRELLSSVLSIAFETESSLVRRNLLYGIFRSPLNRPVTGDDLWNQLRENWIGLGVGNEPATDQYMIVILGPAGADIFLDEMSTLENISNQQLIIEFIRIMDVSGDTGDSHQNAIMKLLSHDNPTVVSEMLKRLKADEFLSSRLLQHIYDHHVRQSRNPVIFLTALEIVQLNGIEIGPMMRKLAFIEDRNPYLTNRILTIYRETGPEDRFLNSVEQYLSEGGIRGFHAAQELTNYWIGLEEQQNIEQVKRLMREAAEDGNRSVIQGLNMLLADESLVEDNDFEWLQERYRKAVTAGNRVNATVFGQAFETRFPERYNELPEPEYPKFRIPDWNRLYAIGTRPYWHLMTEKGDIVIRLDPLSAPFTVSSVDSLTRAGAYDSVAFHRVVHNFVIQGGDVGRGDGFGGPGYRIPTEPSLASFDRGSVGIASSGTDTESSQYFVMHQWAPHLDADYTLFGTVVRGMDVVDRIQIGDFVIEASISVH